VWGVSPSLVSGRYNTARSLGEALSKVIEPW
jgi:hypothetical protein